MTDQEETMEFESAENDGLPDQFQTSAVGPPQGPYTPPDTHQPMGQDGMASSTASNRGVTAAREVDSVSTFTGLQKHTADQDEKTTQASKDVADIHVQIDWADKEPPLKWEKYLRITVQTLFNTTPKYRSYAILNLRTLGSSAHITVSPPEAQQALLELKSTKLNFKGLGEVTVYFKEALLASHSPALVDTPQQKYSQRKVEEARLSQEVPMAVSAKVDLHKYDAKQQKELLIRFPKYRTGSHTLQIDGTYEEVGQFHKELNEALRKPVTATSDHTAPMETSASPLRVPVFQDWHLNNLQSKEIERIQENNGVKIKTDVCVSFEEAGANNTQACAAASQEFTVLFQANAIEIIIVPVPGGYESVKTFVSLDTKLMLQMSSGKWSLIGPRASVNTVQKPNKTK